MSYDTVTTDVIDSQLSLGKGDSVSSTGITFAGTGFNEASKTDNNLVVKNGRYMLLEPHVNGTLTVTHTLTRLYLLELNATSIDDFNTNKLTAFENMNKTVATKETTATDFPSTVLKSKASTTIGSSSNPAGNTVTGTQALKAGSVYALIYFNKSNASGNGITAISYTATANAGIATTGEATTTSESVLDKLTYTAALKYLESGYTVASQGFVFVNYDTTNSSYTAPTDTTTNSTSQRVVAVTDSSSNKLDEVGDAFQLVINNISKLENIKASSEIGIVAVPYIILEKEGSDNVTVWGDPCLPSEVTGYTPATSSTEE